jgi:hypothetical protein
MSRTPPPLWTEDPNVLLRSADLFPVPRQSEAQRVNAATRLIVLVTLAVFAFTHSLGTLLLGALCVVGLAALVTMRSEEEQTRERVAAAATGAELAAEQRESAEEADDAEEPRCVRRAPAEGFVAAANAEDLLGPAPPALDGAADDDEADGESDNDAGLARRRQRFLSRARAAIEGDTGGVYQQPTPINPFGNLLLSDAALRPDRLPAPPLSSAVAREAVYAAMQEQFKILRPGATARMFANSADQLHSRAMMRPFFTNASTAVLHPGVAKCMASEIGTAGWRDGKCRLGGKYRPRFPRPRQ